MSSTLRLAVLLACCFAPAVCIAQTPPATASNAITQPAQKTIGMPQADNAFLYKRER